jgi:hypothetical protein
VNLSCGNGLNEEVSTVESGASGGLATMLIYLLPPRPRLTEFAALDH